jgi:hypothetical protein
MKIRIIDSETSEATILVHGPERPGLLVDGADYACGPIGQLLFTQNATAPQSVRPLRGAAGWVIDRGGRIPSVAFGAERTFVSHFEAQAWLADHLISCRRGDTLEIEDAAGGAILRLSSGALLIEPDPPVGITLTIRYIFHYGAATII